MRRDSSRTAFDRYPIYGFSNGEAQELPANDWRDFVARHADHKLELLTSTGTNYFPDSSGCDPMSGAYVQVGNGEETLLLRRSRSSIEQPFNYEIVHGRLLQADPSLEIQADAISKKMKLHFSPVPAASLNDDHILPVRALDSRSARAILSPHSN